MHILTYLSESGSVNGNYWTENRGQSSGQARQGTLVRIYPGLSGLCGLSKPVPPRFSAVGGPFLAVSKISHLRRPSVGDSAICADLIPIQWRPLAKDAP